MFFLIILLDLGAKIGLLGRKQRQLPEAETVVESRKHKTPLIIYTKQKPSLTSKSRFILLRN